MVLLLLFLLNKIPARVGLCRLWLNKFIFPFWKTKNAKIELHIVVHAYMRYIIFLNYIPKNDRIVKLNNEICFFNDNVGVTEHKLNARKGRSFNIYLQIIPNK